MIHAHALRNVKKQVARREGQFYVHLNNDTLGIESDLPTIHRKRLKSFMESKMERIDRNKDIVFG